MDALYQRLKELPPHTFERLTLDLLKERHPGITITHVDGIGGDQGIDHFAGDLGNRPTIWQAKAFPNGIRATQKAQIKNSLARAIGTSNPAQWVLCTNTDLDAKAHQWYQNLRRQHPTITIGLYQASDIVHELLYRRTIRNQYFPGAALDTDALRALVTRTGELTADELRTLTEENVHQYLQRLQDRDARFNYELTFSNDHAPSNTNPPGTIFTISKDNTLIRASARDHDALHNAPPQIRVAITPSAHQKLQDFLDTGTAQHLNRGDITALTTDLPINDELSTSAHDLTLQLAQHPTGEPLPLRLTCGKGAGAVTYEYLPFQLTRIGTKEAALTSTGPLPFTTTIIIRDHHQGGITFTDHPEGADVQDLRTFMDAIHAINTTNYIEAYDLQHGKTFFRANISNTQIPEHWTQGFEPFIRDLARIADFFDVKLSLPSTTPTEHDHEAFLTLKAIMEGTTIPIEDFTFALSKTEQNTASMLATLDQGTTDVRSDQPAYAISLFQTIVNVGPVTLHILPAPIKDARAIHDQWQHANNGDAMSISIGPAELRITRSTPAEEAA